MSDPLVPRRLMPQIDAKYIPQLIVFLSSQGVNVSAGHCLASDLISHQEVDMFRAALIPNEILAVPILISRDNGILDGNHRRVAHEISQSRCPYIMIDTDFAHALSLLDAFPFTYEVPLEGDRA